MDTSLARRAQESSGERGEVLRGSLRVSPTRGGIEINFDFFDLEMAYSVVAIFIAKLTVSSF